jgi:hypothetical protein
MLHSEYVGKVVGPDVALTNDFETSTDVLATERSIILEGEGRNEADNNLVAWYWVSTTTNDVNGTDFEAEATPVLIDLLKTYAESEVTEVLVNTGITSSHVDPRPIFGGVEMPRYAVVYKMIITSPASARAVRKVQAAFVKRFEERLDAGGSYILFAKEALILDVKAGHRVSDAGYTWALATFRTDRRTLSMFSDSTTRDVSRYWPTWESPLMSATMMPNRARSWLPEARSGRVTNPLLQICHSRRLMY